MFTSYFVYLGFNFCVFKTEKKKKNLKKRKESWAIRNWKHTQNFTKHLQWSALRNS